MEAKSEQLKFILTNMGLNEYQAQALSALLYMGESKATTLSKASGVPDARIYGILEDLAQMGLVIIKPGRPALYSPMNPQEIAEALIADVRQDIQARLRALEDYRGQFIPLAREVYQRGEEKTPRIPLLRIVTVGDVSLEETRKLYRSAKKEIQIMTRAMEYYPKVRGGLIKAKKRGTMIKLLLRSRDSLSAEDGEKRDEILEGIREDLGGNMEVRSSEEVPIRGCIVDPEDKGRALFLVEEQGVPYVFREAAITSHPGVVKGLSSMFNLRWKYESNEIDLSEPL